MRTKDWAVPVPAGYCIGRWEVWLPIATGSWGSVYEGRQIGGAVPNGSLPRNVALKFLATGTLTARRLRHIADMADREVSLYRRVKHDGIARLYETLTVDDPKYPELDGALVLVMELAADSLGAWLRRYPGRPLPDAPRLVAEISEGLAHMHSCGWVHGDLKPSNVLLMRDESVRLADFGLATELEGTHGYLFPVGSLDYMPPERFTEPLGERGSAIRISTDIWALGITAHQLFTGRLPFPGVTERSRAMAAIEYDSGRRELVLPAMVPAGWRAFILDCLARGREAQGSGDTARLAAHARMLADSTERDTGWLVTVGT